MIAHTPGAPKFAWKQSAVFAAHENHFTDFLTQKKQMLYANLSTAHVKDADANLLALLPEPWGMKDIRKAAERIVCALDRGEKITIFGDYDVDGTTSCALLKNFFAALQHPVDIYIPERLRDGYGLNVTGVSLLAEQGTQLIITVDNGIAACEACALAKQLGIDVIITDHHDIPPVLPDSYATLNPKRFDCVFPYRMLAGVGVAFYLMIAVRSLLKEQKSERVQTLNLKSFLDFVAIGTIADMAPLNGVNHVLCKVGLEVLYQHLLSGKQPGLYCLLTLAGWDQETKITATDVGFKIGPRLNAAGRLGNAQRAVSLLLAQSDAEAQEAAEFLHEENAQRQQLEKKMTQEALEQVGQTTVPEALVLHQEDWHPGVVGLVATRVLDKYYRPTLVFGSNAGYLKGSGRSTHGFDLFSALNAVRHEFISFGGHFHAVGLSIAKEKLNWLKEYLAQKAQELIPAVDRVQPLYIDGVLPLAKLEVRFLQNLTVFEPHGIENARFKWLIGPLTVRHIKRIGKDPTHGHARVLLLQEGKELWLTAFGMADAFENHLECGVDIYVVVEAKLRLWNGRTLVDATILDFASSVHVKTFWNQYGIL